MRRALWITVVLAVCSGVMIGSAGCAAKSGSVGSSSATTPEAAVRSFLDASTKHGTLTFVSGKSQKEDKVEYWFDGDKYRLTWYYEDGTERIHMISPDGKKLYHCYVPEEICAISYTLPEMHQWIFNGPPGWDLGEGEKVGDLTAFTYEAKKLWDVEGASQQFYLEDLVIYSDGSRIVKAVTRTNSRKPESEDDLVTSEYRFDEPELDVKLPADVFELPYEMGEKPK